MNIFSAHRTPRGLPAIGLAVAAILLVSACGPDGETSAEQVSDSTDTTQSASNEGTETKTTAEPTTTTEVAVAFEPIRLEGVGSSVERLSTPVSPPVIFVITHDGPGWFSVVAENADGERLDTLVSSRGTYGGRVTYGLRSEDPVELLTIQADGAWTIETQPISAATRWDGVSELSGSGDDVVAIREGNSPLIIADIKHTGESNFVVDGYTEEGRRDFVVNEIGEYSGTHRFAAGTFLIIVTGDGTWTFTPQ